MRREWITEGRTNREENSNNEPLTAHQGNSPDASPSLPEGLRMGQLNLKQAEESPQQQDLEPNGQASGTGIGQGFTNSSITHHNVQDENPFPSADKDDENPAPCTVPEDDDLDALLAEHEDNVREPSHQPLKGYQERLQRSRDDFQDELEAMADLDFPW
jgi:hypothetical protein